MLRVVPPLGSDVDPWRDCRGGHGECPLLSGDQSLSKKADIRAPGRGMGMRAPHLPHPLQRVRGAHRDVTGAGRRCKCRSDQQRGSRETPSAETLSPQHTLACALPIPLVCVSSFVGHFPRGRGDCRPRSRGCRVVLDLSVQPIHLLLRAQAYCHQGRCDSAPPGECGDRQEIPDGIGGSRGRCESP